MIFIWQDQYVLHHCSCYSTIFNVLLHIRAVAFTQCVSNNTEWLLVLLMIKPNNYVFPFIRPSPYNLLFRSTWIGAFMPAACSLYMKSICIQSRLVAYPCSVTSGVNINCVILLGVPIRSRLFKTLCSMYKWFTLSNQGCAVCVLCVISCCMYTNGPLAVGGIKADLL